MARPLLNVLVVAEGAVGVQLLKSLTNRGHDVVGVMTARPEPEASARADLSRQLRVAASELRIPTLPAEAVADPDFASWIRRKGVDLLINAHSLFIADAAVVGAPAIGSFNVHPGPLPRYAGLNAPSWAIYNGETEHGVTLHWMDAGIDTGPVAYRRSFAIDAGDSGLIVSAKCTRYGLQLVSKLLDAAEKGRGSIPHIEQELNRRTYFGKEVPQNGAISWGLPARRVHDFVRACDYFPFPSPWGSPAARACGRAISILKASLTYAPTSQPPGTIGRAIGGAVQVATGDEWLLVRRISAGAHICDAAEILEPGKQVYDGTPAPALAPPKAEVAESAAWNPGSGRR